MEINIQTPDAPCQYNNTEASAWESGFASAVEGFTLIGVINENHEVVMAPRRKTWISEGLDKEWLRFWSVNDCYEKVYVRVK